MIQEFSSGWEKTECHKPSRQLDSVSIYAQVCFDLVIHLILTRLFYKIGASTEESLWMSGSATPCSVIRVMELDYARSQVQVRPRPFVQRGRGTKIEGDKER